jgi:hypothetical protein
LGEAPEINSGRRTPAFFSKTRCTSSALINRGTRQDIKNVIPSELTSHDSHPGVSSVMAIGNHDCMGDAETSLRAENAELRRLLEKHQWAGLIPVKSSGCCPECCGSSPPYGSGHRPGCAIAVILAITAPFDE